MRHRKMVSFPTSPISCYQLEHNPIVQRVEWWFDGKHFSSLNHMKSNCTSYSSCLYRVKGETLGFRRAAVRDVVWHSLAGDRDKLFCVQLVSECQFHMWSHDSIGAFLDCLPDWTQSLRHSQLFSLTHSERGLPPPGCRSIVPALRIIFNRVSILPHFEHLLWACHTWTERTYV